MAVFSKLSPSEYDGLYWARRQRRASKAEVAGELYLLKGRVKKGEPWFYKVGRSIDSNRRFLQHKKKCPIARWTFVGRWRVNKSHTAERLTHLRMLAEGFEKLKRLCVCSTLHNERFVHCALTDKEAVLKIQRIILSHLQL
ncbi:hypothetical protein V5O48_018539 [Marasmius crinis-equi]|uniref:Bacteriophage T5 Orf172 DNA-binding domain-containing protein n=1 Tax=Marasmius crinis-equi TaxID=585013 RepID=A0ABR3EKX2_9AGAR